MKNININDYFKLDDNHSKIRGFVFCRDSSGNFIFNKENMIVKTGRNLILDTITGGSSALNLKNLNAYINNSKDFVTEADVFNTEDNWIELSKVSELPTIDSTNLVVHYTFNTADLEISGKYSSLCLATSNEILFSRVIFQSINVSADEVYTFDYYLSF